MINIKECNPSKPINFSENKDIPLPNEILQFVFSHLSNFPNKDLKNVSQVNKRWRSNAHKIFHTHELKYWKRLSILLSQNVALTSVYQSALGVEKKIKNLSITNFAKLKLAHLMGLEDMMLEMIKIPSYSLKNIQARTNQILLKNIIQLVVTAQSNRIDFIRMEPSREFLRMFSIDQNEYIDFIIAITSSISNLMNRNLYCSELCTFLAHFGAVDEALLLANTFPTPDQKSDVLYSIFHAIKNNAMFKEAHCVAKLILNDDKRSKALEFIVEGYLKEGKIEDAHEIAYSIPNNKIKLEKLMKLIKEYFAKNRTKEAIQVAKTIPNENDRSLALEIIIDKFKENGEVVKAFKVAKAIPIEPYKSRALSSIATEYLKAGKIEDAREVAYLIPNNEIKSNKLRSLTMISDYLKAENIETAHCEIISKKLLWLYESSETNRWTNEAIQFAKTIQDKEEKSLALESILIKLINDGEIEKAYEVANIIPCEKVKSRALRRI